ncbi:MAG: two-component sensor histidine kinase [Litorilinea sp.]|nr:MAG: two-component sensor histidine kinase [Litorilinea sp.]
MRTAIQEFFAYNQLIILFIYGQVFFVLGLVIALQSWRHSRLALARILPWLAAFGLIHGLHEWGDVFIPIQAQYLPPPFVELLWSARLLVLALSFFCLFQFGVESLRPLPGRWRYARYLPGAILLLWLFWIYVPALAFADDLVAWRRQGDILARYTMGFPGGLLAAYGLRRHAHLVLAPLNLTRIVRMLRLAGLALLGYAFFAGLVGPAAPFFPANWINQEQLQAWTLIPVQLYRGLLGLVMAVAMMRALEVFRMEMDRRIRELEEEQLLLAERERIGRELHDSTLQTIYGAGLLLGTVQRALERLDAQPQVASIREAVAQSMALLDQAVADIRRHIGQLRPQPTGQSLTAGLQEMVTASPVRSLAEVELQLALPAELPLAPGQVTHLLAIVNEALSNVARHAQATHVSIQARVAGDRLLLTIEDDGVGLPADLVAGYGLNNMRERARLLGGDMRLHSAPGQGTQVHVDIPIGVACETNTPVVGG